MIETRALTLLEARPTDRAPRPGEVWPMPADEPFQNAGLPYRRDWAGKRRALVVKLPDETELNLDAAHPEGYSYTVTGALDSQGRLSVATLSVQDEVVHGRNGWKGFIRSGQMGTLQPGQRAPAEGEPTQVAPAPQETPQQPTQEAPAPAPAPAPPPTEAPKG